MNISRRRFAQFLGVASLAPSLALAPSFAASKPSPLSVIVEPPLVAKCYSGQKFVGEVAAHSVITGASHAEIFFDATFTAAVTKIVIERQGKVVLTLHECLNFVRGSNGRITLWVDE